MTYQVEFSSSPTNDELQVLLDGLDEFNAPFIGKDKQKNLTYLVKNDCGQIKAGINGNYGKYGWLWIGTLWVSDELRKQGWGQRLLSMIEDEALNNGCRFAYLNCFSFGAVEFYKKQGYEIYAELSDFPDEHSVFSLKKKLA